MEIDFGKWIAVWAEDNLECTWFSEPQGMRAKVTKCIFDAQRSGISATELIDYADGDLEQTLDQWQTAITVAHLRCAMLGVATAADQQFPTTKQLTAP